MSSLPARSAALALLAALALGACAPVRVDLSRRPPQAVRGDPTAAEPEPAPRPVPGPGARRVLVAPVQDLRTDKEALGRVGGRHFSAGDLARTVEDELCGLASADFLAAREQAPDAPAALTLRVRVLKAYVDSLHVTKTAVIVLEVDLVPQAGAVESRRYRGSHASTNWASGEGEVTQAMQEALADATSKVRADVEAWLRRGAGPG